MSEIAADPGTVDRLELLTQAIIEYEDAINILDPDGSGRADEIHLRTAELLLQRAQARVDKQPSEASFDLSRVTALCDLIVTHEGSKERNAHLYRQAEKLQREAKAFKTSLTVRDSHISQ
jgi:hypothetical protein